MESSLRNHAMVSLQNRQNQRHRTAVSGGSGIGASLGAHGDYNQQQQQQQSLQFNNMSQSHSSSQQQDDMQYGGSFPQHQQQQIIHNDPQGILYQQQQQQHQQQQQRHGSFSMQQHQQTRNIHPQQQQQQSQNHRHHSNNNDQMSIGSHYSRESGASSQNSSTVDERYRRLGQRLSMRAHGGDVSSYGRPRRVATITVTPQSGFSSRSDALQERALRLSAAATLTTETAAEAETSSNGNSLNRTNKVAKMRLSDHGDHHSHGDTTNIRGNSIDEQLQPHIGSIVRKMTVNVNELFRIWQKEHVKETKNHKRVSPSTAEAQIAAGDLSPHRRAFSEMALEGSSGAVFTDDLTQTSSRRHPCNGGVGFTYGNGNSSMLNSNNGYLTSVIETTSQTSSKTNSKIDANGDDNGSVRSKESRGSSSIATRSSAGTRNSMRDFVGGIAPRGKCLTQPAEGVANEGLDNTEGNLIVFENDSFSVTRKQIHAVTKEKMKNVTHADFQVQSVLGQGTFAQVFQCLHVQTGQMVAVKVIKNKPAYTRQAAVEIDVFRALTKSSESGNDSGEQESRWDYMVGMVCYFMYKGHLCLVFELLGLNLYEVLKKRQFRGLPLTVVRKLVQQAVLGTKELALKSIVHCDLKPENILLVTEDDVDSVVTAGESKRLSSSLRSHGSLENNQSSKTPPNSTATGTTTAEYSGNSTSTSNTDNTKKKTPQKAAGGSIDESPSTATFTSSLNKTPPTSIPGNNHSNPLVEWKGIKMGKAILSSSPTHSDGTHTTGTHGYSLAEQRIKLIDFGSACFEGQTSHTYIQSRFYRSPEVLVGLTYDSAIDMWSLGCVAAELFLGLPILPGVHELDQLHRIREMIGEMPDWMLDQGSKSQKYFVKFVPSTTPITDRTSPPAHQLPQWRMKTLSEFIASLSQNEIKRKGGLSKLEKQPSTRYFKRKRLAEIIVHKGQSGGLQEEKEQLKLFVHFLYGMLEPDPWKRWTAFQAASHPFLTGNSSEGRHLDPTAEVGKDENHANKYCGYYWKPPSDPTIYRRKLLNVQKVREKQQAARHRVNRHGSARAHSPGSQSSLPEEATTSGTHSSTVARGAQVRPGSYQMSSSYTEYASAPVIADDASSVASGRNFAIHGPQSYSEAGPSGPLPGSFNEFDFAYALQRPGVVPMSDASVASSVDPISVGQIAPYSNHRQHGSQHHSFSTVGSYGSHRVSRNNANNRVSAVNGGMSSRSFDEGGSAVPSNIMNSPQHAHHNTFASTFESGAVASQSTNNPSAALQAQNTPHAGVSGMQTTHQPIDGNLAAQMYFQQQHVALQQQQLLLQQQQAALALQQQQLQAYGMNPLVLNSNNSNSTSGLHPQQFNIIGSAPGGATGAPAVGGGYYYVSAADGTHMLMTANPSGLQGQIIPGAQFPGQVTTSSMMGQSTGLHADPRLVDVMGGQQQEQLSNMVGIPGMVAVSQGGMPAPTMVSVPNNHNSNQNYQNSNNGYSWNHHSGAYPGGNGNSH